MMCPTVYPICSPRLRLNSEELSLVFLPLTWYQTTKLRRAPHLMGARPTQTAWLVARRFQRLVSPPLGHDRGPVTAPRLPGALASSRTPARGPGCGAPTMGARCRPMPALGTGKRTALGTADRRWGATALVPDALPQSRCHRPAELPRRWLWPSGYPLATLISHS